MICIQILWLNRIQQLRHLDASRVFKEKIPNSGVFEVKKSKTGFKLANLAGSGKIRFQAGKQQSLKLRRTR